MADEDNSNPAAPLRLQADRPVTIAIYRRLKKPTGAVLHVQAGTPQWLPSAEELEGLATIFSTALTDPAGGVVVTRNGVTATLLRESPDTDTEKPTVAAVLIPQPRGSQ